MALMTWEKMAATLQSRAGDGWELAPYVSPTYRQLKSRRFVHRAECRHASGARAAVTYYCSRRKRGFEASWSWAGGVWFKGSDTYERLFKTADDAARVAVFHALRTGDIETLLEGMAAE